MGRPCRLPACARAGSQHGGPGSHCAGRRPLGLLPPPPGCTAGTGTSLLSQLGDMRLLAVKYPGRCLVPQRRQVSPRHGPACPGGRRVCRVRGTVCGVLGGVPAASRLWLSALLRGDSRRIGRGCWVGLTSFWLYSHCKTSVVDFNIHSLTKRREILTCFTCCGEERIEPTGTLPGGRALSAWNGGC